MNTQSSSKTGLFLIELIISIFFFIVASAICTQAFVKAHVLSKDTINLNHAFLWTQNLSALFTEDQGSPTLIKNTYSTSDCISLVNLKADDNMLLLFNNDWQPVMKAADACYLVFCSFPRDSQFAYMDICVSTCEDSFFTKTMQDSDYIAYLQDNSHCIYQITLQKYIPLHIAKGGELLA